MKYSDITEGTFDPKQIKGSDHSEKLADYIFENCKPWLSQTDNGYDKVYRGSKIEGSKLAYKVKVRKNRKPLGVTGAAHEGSSAKMHKKYITAFKSAGFEANRNNSVFVCGDRNISGSYGVTKICIPVGEFSFAWSPVVDDLFTYFEDNIEHLGAHYREILKLLDAPEHLKKEALSTKSVSDYFGIIGNYLDVDHIDQDLLNQFIQENYRSENLSEAIRSGHEIMIKCEHVLLIDIRYYNNEVLPKLRL